MVLLVVAIFSFDKLAKHPMIVSLSRWVPVFVENLHHRPQNAFSHWTAVSLLCGWLLKLRHTPLTITGNVAANKIMVKAVQQPGQKGIKTKMLHCCNLIVFTIFT